LAPVIVQNIDAINLHQVHAELAQVGLQRRLGWLVENIALAVEPLRPRAPRELGSKYRGAVVILGNFLGLVCSQLDDLPKDDPKLGIDFLDRTIRTERTLDEVIEASSPISKRWRIATGLQPLDFAAALKDAHGLS
jgi:hypothetical protein